MAEVLLDLRDAAQVLSIRPATLRSYIKQGRANAVRMGKRWRVSLAEVDRLASEGVSAPSLLRAGAAPLDLGALLAPSTPEAIARRLEALKAYDTGAEVEDEEERDEAQTRAEAILEGLHSDHAPTRNAAIIALSHADEETSRIVEEAAARAVEEWQGEEDDLSDWRALDAEPFRFPEEAPDFLTGLYRSDAQGEEVAA